MFEKIENNKKYKGNTKKEQWIRFFMNCHLKQEIPNDSSPIIKELYEEMRV